MHSLRSVRPTVRAGATAVGAASRPARRLTAAQRTPRGLVLPAILFLFVVTQLPFFLTIFYSLRSWNLLVPGRGQEWVWADNYLTLLTDLNILESMVRTVVYTGAVVTFGLALGLVLAFLLHRPFPGRALARTMLLTPMLIMPAASALVWKNMVLHPVYGALPWLLGELGLPRADLLSQQPMVAVILIGVWQWCPFMMLIVLAGLASMDEEQLEAARIDGAGWWSSTRHLVLPHLSSYISVAILLGTIFILPTFDTLFIATAGGPGFATTNLAYAVYKLAFANFDIGLSSALGIINTVFTIVVATVLVRAAGRVLVRGEVLA